MSNATRNHNNYPVADGGGSRPRGRRPKGLVREPLECRVCNRRVVRWVTPRGIKFWAHVPQTMDGHEGEPQRRTSLVGVTPCDFCDGRAEWRIPAMPFSYANGPIERHDGDWSACDECVNHVLARDWRALVKRHPGDYSAQPNLYRLYSALERRIYAPPHRLPGGAR